MPQYISQTKSFTHDVTHESKQYRSHTRNKFKLWRCNCCFSYHLFYCDSVDRAERDILFDPLTSDNDLFFPASRL